MPDRNAVPDEPVLFSICSRSDTLFDQILIMIIKSLVKISRVLFTQGGDKGQDLTGQVIRRVTGMVQEVESSLVALIKENRVLDDHAAEDNSRNTKAEGPIINADKREDVVSGQDEVDDLLSSLGF